MHGGRRARQVHAKAVNYKKGHLYYSPYSRNSMKEQKESQWLPRLTKKEFSLVTNSTPSGTYEVKDIDGKLGSCKLLRPQSHTEPELVDQYATEGEITGELRLVDIHKFLDMFNSCNIEHRNFGQCGLPNLAISWEQQWGVCWKLAMRCTNCDYESRKFNMYDEAESFKCGPKPGAPNLRLAAMLQETTVGPTKARLLLAGTGIPPPSRYGLQKMANKTASITATITQDELQKNVEDLKRAHQLKGLEGDFELNVSGDGRYDSVTYGNRQKMGQNATQMVGLLTENVTDEHKIVAFAFENKLCSSGRMLRAQGKKVTCPGHQGCTATVPAVEPFTERTLGKKMGEDLARQGVRVKYITTDGDAHMAEGMDIAMKEAIPGYVVQRQQDTIHLANSQYRKILKAKFSAGFFPGRTADKRKEEQTIFAKDLTRRCDQIAKELSKLYGCDKEAINRKVPSVVEATVKCYQGNCKSCHGQSLVCYGGRTRNWWKTSFMRTYGLKELNFTEEDGALVRALILERLGQQYIELTCFMKHTNHVEGAWRGVSASLPKNVSFPRTGKGRASAAVHRLIHGVGNSVIKKCAALGSPIPRRGHVANTLCQIQRDATYLSQYKRSKKARKRKHYLRKKQMGAWANAKDRKRSDYMKGQLIPNFDKRIYPQRLQATPALYKSTRN